jgi:hypothetical protein
MNTPDTDVERASGEEQWRGAVERSSGENEQWRGAVERTMGHNYFFCFDKIQCLRRNLGFCVVCTLIDFVLID